MNEKLDKVRKLLLDIKVNSLYSKFTIKSMLLWYNSHFTNTTTTDERSKWGRSLAHNNKLWKLDCTELSFKLNNTHYNAMTSLSHIHSAWTKIKHFFQKQYFSFLLELNTGLFTFLFCPLLSDNILWLRFCLKYWV